jgi:solute carrier family 25 protein 39/40
VVKTRRQAQSLAAAAGKPVPTRTFEILVDIARKEGMAGLMSGLAPRLAKVAPACGILISLYEGLSRYLD